MRHRELNHWMVILVFDFYREIGLPTRSTARKKLDRELIVTCSLSVRLKFDGCFISYVNMYASHVTLLLLSTFMILEYP